MTLSTLTLNATETSLMSAGRWTVVDQALSVDYLRRPTTPGDDPGILCPDTVSAPLSVVLHAEPQRRTVWLELSPDDSPLTGNYVTEIDDNEVTYNATSDNPADFAALITGIVDAINADGTVGGIVEADVVGELIRLRAVVSDTSVYASFGLTADTAYPAAADLQVHRELDAASIFLWGRPDHEVSDAASSSAGVLAGLLTAWRPIRDLGVHDDGYMERLDVAGLAAVWPQLYDTSHTDTWVPSGDEAYHDQVAVYLAVAQSAP